MALTRNADWAEAFTIFAKYQTEATVAAEHDEMWMGPGDVSLVSDDDMARLQELGVKPDDEGGFHVFV